MIYLKLYIEPELLGVFGLEEFDDKVINLEVMNLCSQLSAHTEFAALMLKILLLKCYLKIYALAL